MAGLAYRSRISSFCYGKSCKLDTYANDSFGIVSDCSGWENKREHEVPRAMNGKCKGERVLMGK